MENEQLLEQFDELFRKYLEFEHRQLDRSALKGAIEAKRFAKLHRLLIPYVRACLSITDNAQTLFETEIGIDNAMEIIALVESEEKARKFQPDFDFEQDPYMFYYSCACAYHSLASHTAMRSGYNSQAVHGAIDDGIHVCRRLGMLECIDYFRGFAFEVSLAAGDLEMGEHYARLLFTTTPDDYRYYAYENLAWVLTLQGQLNTALETVRTGIPAAHSFHRPSNARYRFAFQAERICILSGRDTELPELLSALGYSGKMPEPVSREENASRHFNRLVNDALRHCIKQQFAEAELILAEEERFLLLHENLNLWFQTRIQRIASLLLASECGNELHVNLEPLITELRRRATKACQWSAITALDVMLERRVKLNPLGIPFPLDQGPYATKKSLIFTLESSPGRFSKDCHIIHFNSENRTMNHEQNIEQSQEMIRKCYDFAEQQLYQSAMKIAVEAKRFAKTHRLLIPYLHACFSVTNFAQSTFEPDVGADHALEIIALVESEEKAKMFQHDYDPDEYQYVVQWISACAYLYCPI